MNRNELADENTRQALGVMTAWATGEGTGLAVEQIKAIIEEEGVKGLSRLTSGLVNLCGMLLVKREVETHETPDETLRSLASGPLNRPTGE